MSNSPATAPWKRGVRGLVSATLAALLLLSGACSGRRARPLPPAPSTTSNTASSRETTDAADPRELDPTAPKPELDLLVEPPIVQRGESAMLSWESRNAERIVIDHDIGPVITAGRIKLFPEETTSYTVVAEGPGGTLTRTAIVEVALSGDRLSEEDIGSLSLEERFQAFVKPVFFDFDSSSLTEEAGITLDGNIRWFNQPANRNLRFVVEGHCDQRGTEEYNLALGDKRSQVVRAYLIDHGIDAARISTVSLGEERPFATGDSERDYALNRRAHFVPSVDNR